MPSSMFFRCSPETRTPFPPIRPSNFITYSPPNCLIKLSTPSIELNSFLCGFFSGQQRSIIFLAKVLLVSISATSFLGPTHITPTFSSSLTIPLASGFSGPIIAKSILFFLLYDTISDMFVRSVTK